MVLSWPLVIFYLIYPAYGIFPEFAENIPNVTAPIGREATLLCTVDNIDSHKVAWIKMDTQTLLSIHTRVITRDTRIRVSSNNERQWFLHIRDVRLEDQGYYMCQINTEPMVSQEGYLDILVPPSIIEEGTSSDTVVEERSKVSLGCRASGDPPPLITWRREDGKEINLGSYGGKKYTASKVEGEFLNISQVTREDMGAYLCIASNGVQPSVSKRVLLQVNFRPKIRVPNQLVGAMAESDVILECRIEASPQPLTSWLRNDGVMLLNNKKYELGEEEDSYKIMMRIKIKKLNENDFGSYKCVAKNTLGEKEGFIRLYQIPSTTARPTIVQDSYLSRIRDISPGQNSGNVQKKPYSAPSTNSLTEESVELRSGCIGARRFYEWSNCWLVLLMLFSWLLNT